MAQRGRPKSENPRNVVRSVHLTEAELAILEAAATKAGKPLTQYIRERALAAAKRTR